MRVIVADDHGVRQPGRDGAHGRALALVALSGGAKDDDHPGAGFRGSDRFEGALQGVRVVGEVHHGGGCRGYELHPAGHGNGKGIAGVEGGLHVGRLVAAGKHHNSGQRGVGDVEASGQPGVDTQFGAVAVPEYEVGAEPALDCLRRIQSVRPRSPCPASPVVGWSPGCPLRRRARPPRIVNSDDGGAGAARREQPCLGLEVLLHGPVQVKVVLGQVGEPATSNTTASTRWKDTACEETSMEAASSPRSRMSASRACTSVDSGVVSRLGIGSPPARISIVPISPVRFPAPAGGH